MMISQSRGLSSGPEHERRVRRSVRRFFVVRYPSYFKKCLVIWSGLLVLWCGAAAADSPDIRTEIEVKQALPATATAVKVKNGLVTLGLPFSQAECVHQNSKGEPQLQVVNVPKAQVQTLLAYDDGCVQWAGIDFLTDLDPNAVLKFVVDRGTGSYGGSYLATVNGDHIDVNTGPLQATIYRSGANLGKLLGQVVVDGQTFVQASNESRVEGIDLNGVLYTSRNDAGTTVTLEENGPVKAVILMRGSMLSSTGVRLLDYTLRLIFTSGSKQIGLDFFRRNATLVRAIVNYEAINLRLPLNPTVMRTPLSVTYPLAASPWYLTLDLPNDSTQAVFYQSHLESAPRIGNDIDMPWDPNKNGGQGGPAESGYRILTIDPKGNTTTYVDETETSPFFEYMQVIGGQGKVTVSMRYGLWRSFNTERATSNPPELFLSPRDTIKIGSYTEVWPVHDERNEWAINFETGTPPNAYELAANLDWRLMARATNSHRYDSYFAPYGIPTEDEQGDFQEYIGLDRYVNRFRNSDDFADVNYIYAGQAGYPNNSPLSLGNWLSFLRFGHGAEALMAEDRLYYEIGRRLPMSDGFNYATERPGDPIQPPCCSRWSDELEHEYGPVTAIVALCLANREKIERFRTDVAEWLEAKDHWTFPKMPGYARALSQVFWNAAVTEKIFRDPQLKNFLVDWMDYWKTYTIPEHDRGWLPPDSMYFGVDRPFWAYYGGGGRGECQEYNPTARGFHLASLNGRAVRALFDAFGQDPVLQPYTDHFIGLATYTKGELMDPQADGMCESCCMGTTTQQYDWTQAISHPTHGWAQVGYALTGDTSFLDLGINHYRAFATMGDQKQPGNRIELLEFVWQFSQWLGSQSDSSPPVVVKLETPTNSIVRITFDRILDPASAEDLKNYHLAYLAASRNIALQSARARYQTVELTTAEPEQPFEFFRVAIQGGVKSWRGVAMAPYLSPPIIHQHFNDQFTQKDGQPLDPNKWDVFGPGAYRVTVRNNAMNVDTGKSGDWFQALTKPTPFHNETWMLGAIVKPWADTGFTGLWVDTDGAGKGYLVTISSSDQKLSIFTFPGGTLMYQVDLPGGLWEAGTWNTLVVRTGRPQASQRRITVVLNGMPIGDWIDPVVGRYPLGRVGFQIQDVGATVDNVILVDNTRDTTPPSLTVDVTAEDTKAKFSLKTDEYVVGELRYGVAGKFDKIAPLDRRPFVSANVTIYVKPGMTYTWKATVRDLQGNPTIQKGYFTTGGGNTRRTGRTSTGGV